MSSPKKYTKINGVMKLNPEYKRWKEAQDKAPATTVANPYQALPVVTNMEDHEKLCEASKIMGGGEVALSESTNATIEMMQEPDIVVEAGMQVDSMVDELGSIMNKYEVPIGLMNKLMMLTEFDFLEFLIDDSGSMTCESDTVDQSGRPQTRWQEAHGRLKEMIEILAYVPFPEIHILFLNRSEKLVMKRDGREPKAFLVYAYQQIDHAFARCPMGGTPALERLQESFVRHHEKSVARYFFGDGMPNGGTMAKNEIIAIIRNRDNPAMNPVTFLSCTKDDSQVEWMKEAEEIVPYCSECDDFKDESAEVLRDQGAAFPFTRGFYLICSLVAAMNPDDLDAMDESIPFTKTTMDNILGIVTNEESYRHYFDCFVQAQRDRVVLFDEHGMQSKADQLKKTFDWTASFSDFLRAPVANQIPLVQTFKAQLLRK